MVGRITSETNPETGRTTYTYDFDSTGVCSGTYNLDLVKRVDNSGNVTCYQYDGLHRIKWILYPSGPNATNSYAKFFWYDAPYVNNTSSTANLAGRLSAAGTCTTPTCSVNTHSMTHSEYAYDADGRVTDIWEQTPSFSAVNHATKTYWANGLLHSLSGVPGLPTVYYGATDGSGLDGEGRITKVTAASGTNPISCSTPPCVSYNSAGQVTNLVFGSGDSDSYTYDPNTGRMTQYQFSVNGQSLVGKPGWNANGTLATLNITDPFNSGDSQSCTYGYDDLSRLGSVNCGSAWAQTFTYDPFGNITKSGSVSWQPLYNSPANDNLLVNNQYKSGWNGVSYDANGNLLNDTFHTYQYDVDGNITAVDVGGSNYTDYLTYNALGSMVEYKQTYANSNPTWLAQQVYGDAAQSHKPLGKNILSGGTVYELPLPAGAAMMAWSGAPVYGHADWLGSIRLNSTTGRTVNSDVAFAPFGEVYNSPTTFWYEFAGLNNNLTDNVWDADARRYHAKQGRWLSPDPAGLSAVNLANPQSWNRYAYVLNNPLRYADPLGLYCQWADGTRDDEPSRGGATYEECVGDANNEGKWIDTVEITVTGDKSEVGTTTENGEQIFPSVCPGSSTAVQTASGYWTSWGDPNNPFWPRLNMLGTGLLNIGIGYGKVGTAAGLTAGSGGLLIGLGMYGAWSASGNFAAGGAQVFGAFASNPQPFNNAAQIASVFTSVAGMSTVMAGGTIDSAANNAKWEGIFMSGFKAGATGNVTMPQVYSGVVTASKLVGASSSGCK
jgi:RHS repeat-associated protein